MIKLSRYKMLWLIRNLMRRLEAIGNFHSYIPPSLPSFLSPFLPPSLSPFLPPSLSSYLPTSLTPSVPPFLPLSSTPSFSLSSLSSQVIVHLAHPKDEIAIQVYAFLRALLYLGNENAQKKIGQYNHKLIQFIVF